MEGPAGITDADAALVALVGDPRPARASLDGFPLAIGEVALLALAKRWHGDPRWLVGSAGDTIGTRAVLARDAAALPRWHAAHAGDPPAARDAQLVAQAPLEALASPTWYRGFAADSRPAIGRALGARFARGLNPEQDRAVLPVLLWFAPELDRSAWPGDDLHHALDLVVALREVPAGPPGERLLAIDRDLSPEAPPFRRRQGYGPQVWEMPRMLDPERNLGLLVYPGDAHQRTLLLAARQGSLALPVPAMLAALAGGNAYPVLGDVATTDLWRTTAVRPVDIARDLAEAALGDDRVIPGELAGQLREWASGLSGHGAPDPQLCPGLRVCDWAAARLIDHPEDLALPASDLESAVFLKMEPGRRDAVIRTVRTSITEARHPVPKVSPF